MTWIVREWTDRDTTTEVAWFEEDPTLWQYMPGFDRAPTGSEIRWHMAQRLEQRDRGAALVLAVESGGDQVRRLAGQFVLHPYADAAGSAHILIAPWAHGHGIAIFRAGVQAALERGVRRIIGVPSARLPLDVYERFMRRVGFAIKFYGEITT